MFDIVKIARANQDIELIRNDGTQFVAVEYLAHLYKEVLGSDFNRTIFMGNGDEYIAWEEIAEYAIKRIGSSSKIIAKDLSWSKGGYVYNNEFAKKAFSLRFDSRTKLYEHIRYIIETQSA